MLRRHRTEPESLGTPAEDSGSVGVSSLLSATRSQALQSTYPIPSDDHHGPEPGDKSPPEDGLELIGLIKGLRDLMNINHAFQRRRSPLLSPLQGVLFKAARTRLTNASLH